MGKLLVLAYEHTKLVIVNTDVIIEHRIGNFASVVQIIIHEGQNHVTIKSFELICFVDIIVVAEHRHGETLAESARADKEEVAIGVLNLLYKSSLIDIVLVILANCHEVHHAVGNAYRFYCCILFFHTKL